MSWNLIPLAPGYAASDAGEIRREDTRKILRPANHNGYGRVTISSGGARFNAYVHRLVAAAFLGPCPEGHQLAHKDGNRSNNSASNLYWATPVQNAADRDAHGMTARGERSGAARLTEEQARAVKLDANLAPVRSVAAKFGISPSQVHRIKHGLSWATPEAS